MLGWKGELSGFHNHAVLSPDECEDAMGDAMADMIGPDALLPSSK